MTSPRHPLELHDAPGPLAPPRPAFRGGGAPTHSGGPPPVAAGPLPWLGLATSLPEEHDYEAEIEGRVPAALRGALFRNGPGLFERGGVRKRCVLDGDGMIQSFAIGDGGVRYRNRFTRTAKFVQEQAAGAYRFASWTTRAPGGAFANLFGRSIANQAGVSTALKNGRLYAFDESGPPHELDPETLETRGLSTLGLPEDAAIYAAHSKTDARTGEWLHFGVAYGRRPAVHLNTFAKDGRPLSQRTLALPRSVYLHDWFVSERHVILNLHPAELSILPFLLGWRSFAESIGWKPERGNLLLVIPREGRAEPVALEIGAAWMWHSLNAHERGGEIIADFVGYDSPDHFVGDDPDFYATMSGRRGRSSPGSLRRYVIDPPARRVREETLAGGDLEFPIVNPQRACRAHRFGYFARGNGVDPYWTQVARIDTRSGRTDVHDFGAGRYCGEAIFAPEPGDGGESASAEEPGWLLTLVYDSRARRSSLAVLRADRLADGPLAWAHLRHHSPLSFHGWWEAAS